MKTVAVFLALFLHAHAASLGQDPGSEFSSGDDASFLASLLDGAPLGSETGPTEDNTGVLGGSNAPQKKIHCGNTSDPSSLTNEQFIALLNGNCLPEEPPTPPPTTEKPVQTCERGEFQCTPYQFCREEDIFSDNLGDFSVRINHAQFQRDQEIVQHSECPRFGEVCCSNPQPANVTNPNPEPYVPRCGRRNQDGLGLRISGFKDSETQFAEFPWEVIVLKIENIAGEDKLTFLCAGSLVHPQVIVTAAHSVADVGDARLLVRLGEWDTQKESELYLHEDIPVREIQLHPKFHRRLLRDDVAMLVMEHPVELHHHIDTLCLPSPDVDYDFSSCVTAGWGRDALQGGSFQLILKKAELPHVPREECQKMLRKTKELGRYFRLDRSFTCAGGIEGQDACKGDGGAPLACRDPHQPDRWVQVGVVSWGIGCGEANVPGVYADVRPHVDWILETVDRVEKEQGGNSNLSLFERSLPKV